MVVTEEIRRLVNRAGRHADGLFVGEDRTTSITCWDDGDFRIEVYGGFDTKDKEVHHGEQIRYKDSEGKMVYSNFTRRMGWHMNRCLKEYVLEELDQ